MKTSFDKAKEEVIEEHKETLERLAEQPAEPTAEQIAYMEFVKRNHARASMFVKANGHTNLPIIKTAEGYTWLNRKQRRTLKKRK
jgi:hypothetical protein